MGKLYFVEGNTGRQFAVKVLTKGDKYGLNDRLVFRKEKNVVEFYDVDDAGTEGCTSPLGNFTGGSYFVGSIMKHTGRLSLYLGIPEWTISAENIEKIKHWLYKNNWDQHKEKMEGELK